MSAKARPHSAAHRARWREFADRGDLLMIGPFANAQEDGAMGIFAHLETLLHQAGRMPGAILVDDAARPQ